ncbi:MAG: hypothetical protein R2710_05330 [Acidimicrobiales bacterium]
MKSTEIWFERSALRSAAPVRSATPLGLHKPVSESWVVRSSRHGHVRALTRVPDTRTRINRNSAAEARIVTMILPIAPEEVDHAHTHGGDQHQDQLDAGEAALSRRRDIERLRRQAGVGMERSQLRST